MWDTAGGEIVGIEICCLGGLPISRRGMPICGVGSDAVLLEPGGGRWKEEHIEEGYVWKWRVAEKL